MRLCGGGVVVLARHNPQSWFTEYQTDSLNLGFRIDEILLHEKSPFQDVLVVRTETYGRLLALDGAVQTTQGDEFVYHEMITHVPLFMMAAPKKVAVIGGGDGGSIREILKHASVQEAHLVEIDGRVVSAARQFFPEISCALDDPRAQVHLADGIEWVRQARDYDLIIVDSTDPVGPATGLFSPDFYQSIAEALAPGGILVAQSESPYLHQALIKQMANGMRTAFSHVRLYLAAIPTYPSGLWSFLMASQHLPEPHARYLTTKIATRYWTPHIQSAAFVLPRFVEEFMTCDG
ncbi:MAG: spermidine synthase [Sulfobacillus acidophilus]|uniref:Polyamine aminopropyltransferase n=1 Tax=Sulfobacillus acidophilus TaxID=53633 RepID=A0A2T2WLP0_9FIRM|nr:MAG: spermidine synthase [Sulfobacillus acidophilus]